jgi:8-oxo-dGTP diphosphatase
VTDDSDPTAVRVSVLFFRGDAVLLCRRTDEGDVWVLPGGTPKRGEGTAGAARREVAEETGLQIAAERVVFVLETTSWNDEHHLVEIVFLGSERDPRAEPVQLENRLEPAFVPIEDLSTITLRPPIAGYIKGFAQSGALRTDMRRHTASYLGNVWRPPAPDMP